MEEKGGYLHTIIMFVGVACLALGVFYYFTETEKTEELVPIQTEDLNDNLENEIILGNGNKIKLLSNALEEENKKELLYDGESLISFDDLNLINQYFVYNDYIVVFSYSLIDKIGVIYTIDSEKQVEKIEEIDLNNRIMKPISMEVLDNKLIVDGSRVNDSTLSVIDGDISLCDDDLALHSIFDDSPLKVEYSMNIINKNISFDFVKIVDTVSSVKKIVCTIEK